MIRLMEISALGNTLVSSAIRTIIVGGVAALGLALFRVQLTSVRLFVWRSVLAAAIAMPVLGTCLPSLQIRLPRFGHSDPEAQYAPRENEGSAHVDRRPAKSITPAEVPYHNATVQQLHTTSANPLPAFKKVQEADWKPVAFSIYVVAAFILLIRLAIGIFLGRRLVRASREIPDARLHQLVARHASRFPTLLLESDLVFVPLTIGALKPAVLLPQNWTEWDDDQLHSVIAHEFAHVARRDALMQHLSLLHRAVFWFSPFAWWLDRHLVALAELASDEAALANGTDCQAYARTLLGFFESLRIAPGRVRWQGVSMANGGRAELRVQRILAWKGAVSMSLKKSVIAAIVTLAVPLVYIVGSVRPASAHADSGSSNQSTFQTAPAPAAPSSPTAASAGGVTEHAPTSGVVTPAIAGAPSEGVTEGAPVAPVAPVSSYSYGYGRGSGTSASGGYSSRYGYDDDDRFIIASGKTDSYTMSGSTQDIHHVERLKKQVPGDFIWFQRDEKSYIIRDQATIDRARAFWAPQEELGKKQEELGKQQEALGRQQEELGRKQEQVRVNVPPDLAARLDALKARLQKLGANATMDQMGDLQSEIGDLQSKIGELQSQAGEQQSKLGEEQGKLGEQQGKLGEEQGKLGEEQGRLAEEASKKMKALLDECIKNGTAKPEPGNLSGASL